MASSRRVPRCDDPTTNKTVNRLASLFLRTGFRPRHERKAQVIVEQVTDVVPVDASALGQESRLIAMPVRWGLAEAAEKRVIGTHLQADLHLLTQAPFSRMPVELSRGTSSSPRLL